MGRPVAQSAEAPSGPPPVAKSAGPPPVARDVAEARNVHKLVRAQGRQGALGHVQGERALSRLGLPVDADSEGGA